MNNKIRIDEFSEFSLKYYPDINVVRINHKNSQLVKYYEEVSSEQEAQKLFDNFIAEKKSCALEEVNLSACLVLKEVSTALENNKKDCGYRVLSGFYPIRGAILDFLFDAEVYSQERVIDVRAYYSYKKLRFYKYCEVEKCVELIRFKIGAFKAGVDIAFSFLLD